MSQAPSNRRPSSSTWLIRIIVFFALSIILLASAGWIVVVFGTVSGSEFSPYLFQRRSFAYVQIPLLGMQLTPVKHTPSSGDLESHLTTSKVVATAADARWDFINGHEGASISPSGDAHILCLYLDARDDTQKLFWLEWTKDNPTMAGKLWPAVAEVARKQAYVLVPALMDCAKTATSPVTLQRDLELVLVDKYSTFGLSQQQLGRHESAVELFTAALQHDAKHKVSLEGRAKSLEELGEKEKVKVDRDALKQQPKSEAAKEEEEGG